MCTTASFRNMAAAALTRDLPEALGKPALPVAAARLATLLVAVAATGIGVASQRAVAILGVIGWGCFTAALLPVFTVGLAWRGVTSRAAAAAMTVGAATDLALESVRGSLPAGLEPGLAGAALGALVLVTLARSSR